MEKRLAKKVYFYVIAVLILAVSFLFDNAIASFFSVNKIPFLDWIFIFVINKWGIYLFFAMTIALLLIFKKKKDLLPFLIAFALMFITTEALKIIVARPRPFTKFNFNSLGETDINKSFPSGHASAVASSIKFLNFKKAVYFFWIAITLVVMFSRVYLGMHYLSDVIAGAIVGYAAGDLTFYVYERIRKKKI